MFVCVRVYANMFLESSLSYMIYSGTSCKEIQLLHFLSNKCTQSDHKECNRLRVILFICLNILHFTLVQYCWCKRGFLQWNPTWVSRKRKINTYSMSVSLLIIRTTAACHVYSDMITLNTTRAFL